VTATIQKLYSIFGSREVFIPIARGKKGPAGESWQKITFAETQAPAYQRRLAWHAKHGNIGIRQGETLQSIDIDLDELVAVFLKLNPFLADTAMTKAKRGCQFHVRCKDAYPNGQAVYKITHRLKLGSDKKPLKVMEWRCGGGGKGSQSVISGQHPDKVPYRYNGKPVVEIEFNKLRWPADVKVPWIGEPPKQAQPTEKQLTLERKGSVRLAEAALFKGLSKQHGPPIYAIRADRPTLNEPFFAALYAAENCVLFEADEQKFYQYDATDGLYHFTSEHQILRWLERRLLQASRCSELAMNVLAALRSVRHLAGIVRHLKGQVEEKDAFAGDHNFIHVANGVLDLSGEETKLLPFSPESKSRNGIPISYIADAKAPKFENQLLILISPDDRVLYLKFLGQFLTGRNLIQRILIHQGLPETGKSTLAQITKLLIGERNCTELRTKHLANRFEIGRLYGRTLVIGADVSARFLNEEGAYRLKAIVGGDMLDAEKKCSNVYFTLTGDFNVLLTANCRLVVQLAGDRGAWERRIAIIDHVTERKGKRITDFARKLIKQEGPGILNLALSGLRDLRADIKSGGDIVFTDEQRERTKALLDESDGLRMFLKAQMQTKAGSNLTTEEIIQQFATYCTERKWTMASAIVEKQLPDLMLELFSVNKSNNIERTIEGSIDGKTTERKGYRGIAWRPEEDYE
jgi:P4 family phage/plasmid primase-like protien